jgi:hypothetical protein
MFFVTENFLLKTTIFKNPWDKVFTDGTNKVKTCEENSATVIS